MENSFGSILKKSREQHGLSMKQVSVAIKVNAIVIENIEDEKIDLLPKPVFTRGLIRTYCKYLEIDEAPVLSSFDEKTEYHVNKAKRINLISDEEPTRTPLFITFSRTFLPIFIVIFLAGAGYGVFFITQKYKNEISTIVTGNVQEIHTAKDGADKSTSEMAETDPTTATTQNPVTALPNTTPAATTTTVPAVTTLTTPATAPTTKPATTVAEPRPEEITQRITLEPLAKTLVQIQLDDQEEQKIILRPDVNRTFQAKKTIKLKISDAGAVNIIHNRQDLGVPGIFGQPIEMQFPRNQ